MKKSAEQNQKEECYCLGIESSADDFGIGISSFKGEILANKYDSYIPAEGGIHPREAARHHSEVAHKVLYDALKVAGMKPEDLSIIAFSQGPGLGPSLRTGATVARALASYLNIPLVGVNHSLAHIEIGKLKTGVADPVTLYVSGGNTMVTAFEAGRYRVFGETLDIALGNCLDVFAREAGLKHQKGVPLGAAVELLAIKGKNLAPLPYVVKGMDLSLSGLLTSATTQLHEGKYCLEDLCYSLQEHAFSMVTEVTERALAHTEKKEVLLTGGVAANKRLQSMLEIIAKEHDAEFRVVPLEFATDNGAMIAWTGVLAYKCGLITPLDESFVKLRWRVDKVDVPWINFVKEEQQQLRTAPRCCSSNQVTGKKLFSKGAEASLYLEDWHERKVLIKVRIAKKYRPNALDMLIRNYRTIHEPQLMREAKAAQVPTPLIYMVNIPDGSVTMEFVEGQQIKQLLNGASPDKRKEFCIAIGKLIGRLHSHGLIHGDLTTSNMILSKEGKIFFVDFGLGEKNIEVEAQGVDLHLMKRALQSTHYLFWEECFKAVLCGYSSVLGAEFSEKVYEKIKEIERRGRYVEERKQ